MNDLHKEIDRLAPFLNDLQYDKNAILNYSVFSDALVWSDESPASSSNRDGILRYLLRYRTSIIDGKPIEALHQYWEVAQKAFPDWPGFAKARCEASKSLKAALDVMRNDAQERLRDGFGVTVESKNPAEGVVPKNSAEG